MHPDTFKMLRLTRSFQYLRVVLFAAALISLSACSLTTDAPTAHAAVIQDGDRQTAAAGIAFPTALTVLVVDQYGFVMSDVPVTWAITSGGGSLSATDTKTDVNGVVAVTYTAGPTPGPATISATVAGVGTLTFAETIS